MVERLEPGDIVLTADSGKTSRLVRVTTRGIVSHAMICVQYGSVIDSTDDGVQASNIQRQLYDEDAELLVFRLRDPLSQEDLNGVIEFARAEIGTRYSTIEAARSIAPTSRRGSRQMFCSRLVARAYASVGRQLALNSDYCTPEEVRLSPLLVAVSDMVESVSDEEIARWRDRPNPVADTRAAQNAVLAVARRLDPAIENFTDLDRLVRTHPEWDAEIARAYRDSGYLDLWKTDFEVNTWHYDLNAIERLIPRPISGMFWPASQTTPSTALANSPPGTGRAMPGLSRQHKQLSKALLELDEEAMLLEELDGFIAGSTSRFVR